MSEPRRFKLVEDPEGPLTENDFIHGLGVPEVIPPAPEPQYPEWSDEWCQRVDRATCPWQPEGYVADGRTHLKRFHDAGLLVVERDEWERLRAAAWQSHVVTSPPLEVRCEHGAQVFADNHECTECGPAPSYSDEEIERLTEDAERAFFASDETNPWLTAVRFLLGAARPDPAKWVSRDHFDKVWGQRDEARARIAELEADVAEAERARDHATERYLVEHGHDLRPTEEQVREQFTTLQTYRASEVATLMRAHGWLRDTEAPPAPPCFHGGGCSGTGPDCAPGEAPPASLPAEVQGVLDAAAAVVAGWDAYWTTHTPKTRRLCNAIHAYEATLPKEADQ